MRSEYSEVAEGLVAHSFFALQKNIRDSTIKTEESACNHMSTKQNNKPPRHAYDIN